MDPILMTFVILLYGNSIILPAIISKYRKVKVIVRVPVATETT